MSQVFEYLIPGREICVSELMLENREGYVQTNKSSWNSRMFTKVKDTCTNYLPTTNLPQNTLRPVSPWEYKHWIGPFSILYYPHCWTKKVENTSTLYRPGCGSQVQTGTENCYRKPMLGFNFVPIRSDPMFIFLSGNRPTIQF